MGTCVVFQWARAVLSPQFLSLIPSDIDRAVLMSEVTTGLQLTTDLTSDVRCPALQGQWEDILRAQIKLIELLTKWQEEKSSAASNPLPVVNNNDNDHNDLNHCEYNETGERSDKIMVEKSNFIFSDESSNGNIPENCLKKLVNKKGLIVENSSENVCVEDKLNQAVHNMYVIADECPPLDLIPSSLTCVIPTHEESLSSSKLTSGQISMTVGDNNSQLVLVTTGTENPVVDLKSKKENATNADEKEEELYMNIVLASKKEYTSPTESVSKENTKKLDCGVREENPLDRLCQLLRIDEEEFTCETNDKECDIFERRRRYEDNMPFKYFCTNCSYKTKRENQFLKHQNLHEKHKAIYRCNCCQFTTIRIATLRRHELQHNENHVVNCPKCPYKTDSLKFLRRHIQARHSANNPAFQCSHCEFSAGSLRELKKHRHTHNPVKPKVFWNCSLCSYKTQNKGHLKRHKNDVHESVRSYLCHQCGKSFKRHDTLKQHKMTHGEIGPSYTCSQCNKICRSTAQLKEHMTVHTTLRPFLCELCGATFKTRSNQSKHLKMIHSAIKLVLCPVCKRLFNNKATMMRHQKTHCRKENNDMDNTSSTSKTLGLSNPQTNENLNNETVDNLQK